MHRHAVIALVTTPESALTASSLYSLVPRLGGYETIYSDSRGCKDINECVELRDSPCMYRYMYVNPLRLLI